LEKSEKAGEVVFIIGHIPPGHCTFLTECNKRYNILIERYQNIIRGQFFGHTHNDEFKIIKDYYTHKNSTGIILTAPSLTTYYKFNSRYSFLNPSFRVYNIEKDSFYLKDYLQYRLNITKANMQPDIDPQWEIAYNSSQAFGVTHLYDYTRFDLAIAKITNDKDYFNFIFDMYFSQGSHEKQRKLRNMPKYISCRFKSETLTRFFECTGFRTCNIYLS